jgi:hypothetical protein
VHVDTGGLAGACTAGIGDGIDTRLGDDATAAGVGAMGGRAAIGDGAGTAGVAAVGGRVEEGEGAVAAGIGAIGGPAGEGDNAAGTGVLVKRADAGDGPGSAGLDGGAVGAGVQKPQVLSHRPLRLIQSSLHVT